jgi:hypothetical protein
MEIKLSTIIEYQDINDILAILSEKLKNAIISKLIGIYLIGSLSYDDFDQNSSDIDLFVLLNSELSNEQIEIVKNIHDTIAKQFSFWAKRIECSYIIKEMLNSIHPPINGRLYINNGQMYIDAKFGNEWLINLHNFYECGITLFGPEPKNLIKFPLNIEAVREASKQDFYQEWEPLLKNPSILKDSHYQAYIILTLCRILYRERNEDIVSKKAASSWVKEVYCQQWKDLIEEAEEWQYGKELNLANEVLKFIEFVADELK